jgi:hypothetical protein
LLGATLVTGFRAKRKLHIPLVALTVASLVWAIVMAERTGQLYDLEAAGRIKDVHLALAKTATLAYLLPLATGIATLRNPRRRALHKKCAFLAVALTLLAFGTGTWMMLKAEKLAPSVQVEVPHDPGQAE